LVLGDATTAERQYQPIQVIEEAKKVKTQFEKGLFLVTAQSPENFSCIIHMALFPDPVKSQVEIP